MSHSSRIVGGAIKSVAFIGTGIMGAPMARHLLDAGFQVTVYNRTASKCAPLVERGARLAASPAEAAADADAVITMVGYPEDVEDLYLSRGGLVEASKPGAYLIDMTTSSPELARDIAEVAEVSQRRAFDAPVTGGQQGAEEGTLTVFCGAGEADVEPVRPLFEAFAAKVVCFGGPGKGQMAKLANQTALAGCMVGLMEAASLAREGGLDLAATLDALKGGMADSHALDAFGAKIASGDYAPGFMVEHYVKDLGLVLQAAEDAELTLPGAETANQLYNILAEIGGRRMGTQALDLVYRDEATCAAHGLDWSVLGEDEDEGDFAGADHGDGCDCGCHGHDHDCDHDCDGDCDGDCACGRADGRPGDRLPASSGSDGGYRNDFEGALADIFEQN